MKIISFEEIQKLNITPEQCVTWARSVIKHKNDYVLPHKISIKYGDNCYFNTMPSYIPELNLFGVKVVSRIPKREPALQGDILLYNTISGEMLTFMDGTWITAWRTAAVAAITVEALKKPDSKSISIIGLGNIARAFVLCINSIYNNREIFLKILAYKNQHTLFIERFKEYKNIHIEVYEDTKKLIKESDVIVSCVTAKDDLFADEKDFKKGVLVVPVMTRGFQNCDLAFDKIFCDDIPHISEFRYFNQYKSVIEMTEVLNNKDFIRNEDERLLAYNIGISVQDVYFASKILDCINTKTNQINQKFWI